MTGCAAALRVGGEAFACTLDHDPRSGNPDESPHEHDMGEWSLRWRDRDSGITEAASRSSLSAPEECPECGSSAMEWFDHRWGSPQLQTPPRYLLDEVRVEMVLGCECGATVKRIPMVELLDMLNGRMP